MHTATYPATTSSPHPRACSSRTNAWAAFISWNSHCSHPGKMFCLSYLYIILIFFPEYHEIRNITLLYLFCTRLYSIPYCAASCFVELQAIITAISEMPALPAKPWNAQLFSGNLWARWWNHLSLFPFKAWFGKIVHKCCQQATTHT